MFISNLSTGKPDFASSQVQDLAYVGWGTAEQIKSFGLGTPGGAVPQLFLTGPDDGYPPVFQRIATTAPARRILRQGKTVGMIYEDAHNTYALLIGVLPTDLDASREAQTQSVFENIEDAVADAGMTFKNVVRTWLYMDKILDWYDPFNRARDVFFASRKVYDNFMPASTGIGSANLMGSAIAACAIAVQPKHGNVKIHEVPSPLQCSAARYKSSFARAAEIDTPNSRTLFISGTASIEQGGATAFVGDIDKQTELTMKVIEEILTSRNMSFTDTVQGAVYIKHPEYRSAWRAWLKKNNLESIAISEITADVCRDDLLIEVELCAVKLV